MLIRFWRDFRRDARAATAIEYGLIAAFVSLAVVAGASSIGGRLAAYFGRIGANLS